MYIETDTDKFLTYVLEQGHAIFICEFKYFIASQLNGLRTNAWVIGCKWEAGFYTKIGSIRKDVPVYQCLQYQFDAKSDIVTHLTEYKVIRNTLALMDAGGSRLTLVPGIEYASY